MAYSLGKLEEAFAICLELPEADREAYIAKASQGNPEMQRVLSLMIKNEREAAGYFSNLQRTIAGGLEGERPPELTPGAMLGNYRITKFLARGGMSNIYLAERADGQYEQVVAVKCIAAAAFTTRDVMHRIGEQQILAKLRHPGIATLYDAGVTAEGVPYFIMEYIDGLPADEWVMNNNPDLRERLVLFKRIASAVAYAHNHLILHLDLKPSNILIDNSGQVKLLDFGIAKALASGNQGTAAFAATPAIAAPEQLKGGTLTAATDIYQLGMLLYRLLTGKYPMNAESGETEFTPVKSAGEKKLTLLNNPGLKAIVSHCLEQEPDKRYRSISGLMQDIDNYLHDYPLEALPSGNFQKFKLFLRRHRAAVTSTFLIVAALATGAVISLWQAGEARKQRDLAVNNEQVSTATTNFLLDLFMSAHPSKTRGDTMTVFQFLDRGYEEAGNYRGPAELRLAMLTTIGKLYRSLGDYTKSRAALDKAFALARDSALPLSVSYIGAVEQLALYQRDVGNNDSALRLMKEVMNLYRVTGHPEKDSTYTASLKYLSYIYRNLEKTDSAEMLIRKAIGLEEQIWPSRRNINLAESYYILGVLQRNKGEYQEAVNSITASLELCESIMGTNFPGTIANLNLLAGTLSQAARYEEALVHSRRARNIAARLYGENHMETATSADNLGSIFMKSGATDSAAYYFRTGLSIRHRLYPERNNTHVMISTNNMLSLFVKTQRPDSVYKYLKEALRVGKSTKVQARQRAVTYWLAGEFYEQIARPDSARYYYERALAENRSYLPENDERIKSVLEKLKSVGYKE